MRSVALSPEHASGKPATQAGSELHAGNSDSAGHLLPEDTHGTSGCHLAPGMQVSRNLEVGMPASRTPGGVRGSGGPRGERARPRSRSPTHAPHAPLQGCGDACLPEVRPLAFPAGESWPGNSAANRTESLSGLRAPFERGKGPGVSFHEAAVPGQGLTGRPAPSRGDQPGPRPLPRP